MTFCELTVFDALGFPGCATTIRCISVEQMNMELPQKLRPWRRD
jgi:hypothetical protein